MKAPTSRPPAFPAALPMVVALALAVGNAHADYKGILPDTLLPCVEYAIPKYPFVVKVSAAAALPLPAAASDTFDLAGNGSRFRIMAGQRSADASGGPYYTIATPCQAHAGDYELLDLNGRLIETKVTHVADVARMIPTLDPLFSSQGSPGLSYPFYLHGTGLIFGALPPAGAFQPTALRAAYFERSGSRMDLSVQTLTDPYHGYFNVNVPASAALGYYRLVVERADGVKTIAENAFLIDTVPAPRIKKVDPAAIDIGIQETLTITGANFQYGYISGSTTYATPMPGQVQSVFVRNSQGTVVNGTPSYAPGGITATFLLPNGFPFGAGDLGMVVFGRPDTTIVKGVITMIAPGEPKLLSVAPPIIGRTAVSLAIAIESLPQDISQWRFSLRKGAVSLAGVFETKIPGKVNVYFPFSSANDTGSYDLAVSTATGESLVLPQAVTVKLPAIGTVTPNGLTGGSEQDMSVGFDYVWNETQVIGGLPNQGSSTLIPSLTGPGSMRLCRGSDCLQTQGIYSSYGNLHAHFSLPQGQAAGVYDLTVTSATIYPDMVKKAAVLIAPPGYRPITRETPATTASSASGSTAAYWQLAPDSLSVWGFDPSSVACPVDGYRMEDPIAGLSYTGGVFRWQPAVADTGWHYLSLAGIGACAEKIYLAVNVAANPGAGLRGANASGKKGALGPALIGSGAVFFRIRLDQSSTLELTGLDGKRLVEYTGLGAGIHDLLIPPAAAGRRVLLCRVSGAGSEAWLRLVR